MQETNSKLQESLSRLTAQNTQAAKDLAEAKDKARLLEEQLSNTKKGCAMPGCMGVVVLVIIAVATACIL